MKTSGKKLFLLSAVFTAAAVLCAGEADERRLGDRAFYSDDFATAISHYKSAQKLSEDSFFSEAWTKNTLRLCKAQLLHGDIEGAKETLKEFRKRHPMRSAGTLDADILAAEKKFAEAEKLYLAMANTGDVELACSAGFGRAVMLFNQGRFSGAEKLLREIMPQAGSKLQMAIRRELAYTLIQQDKNDEALALLDEIPAEKRENVHDILIALAEVKSGKLANFKKNWHELVKNNPRIPDRRCCELLVSAANLLEKQSDRALSAELLKAADRFAATPEDRQKILKKLINLESSFEPASAAESAKNYFNAFPAAADRFDVLISAAGILADDGRFSAAADLLKQLLDGSILPPLIRCQAASNGAFFAEKAGSYELAEKFYAAASESAVTTADRVNALRKYAAFLMRQKKYKPAVAALSDAVKIDGNHSGDDLKEELLDASVRDRNSAVVTQMAEALKNSPVPRYRSRAHYELAEVAAAKADFAAARNEYLAAASQRDAGQYAVAGRFGAALAAFKLGNFSECASEALQLALEYPARPQAPQALYMAYTSARQINDSALKKKCADILTEKYPSSEAYAVYALQNAADRSGLDRDHSGAVADLEELENRFSQLPEIVTESMLMRAGILNDSGKGAEALECADMLISRYPESSSAYYAAMLAGNINFAQLKYEDSLKYFNKAAAMRTSGLENELARSMAIESMFQLAVSKDGMIKDAIAECDKLTGSSKFAHIRVEMRYRKAVAMQRIGKDIEALTGYELLLNEAVECASNGQMFDRNRCLRGAAAALQIVISGNKRSLYLRGLRIIERCKQLQLDKNGLDLEKLRAELVQKFSSKRKRR